MIVLILFIIISVYYLLNGRKIIELFSEHSNNKLHSHDKNDIIENEQHEHKQHEHKQHEEDNDKNEQREEDNDKNEQHEHHEHREDKDIPSPDFTKQPFGRNSYKFYQDVHEKENSHDNRIMFNTIHKKKSNDKRIYNDYYDVDLKLDADNNDLDVSNLSNMIHKIKTELQEKTKEKINFKNNCQHVLFTVSYPKMYFRKDELKKNDNSKYKYYSLN